MQILITFKIHCHAMSHGIVYLCGLNDVWHDSKGQHIFRPTHNNTVKCNFSFPFYLTIKPRVFFKPLNGWNCRKIHGNTSSCLVLPDNDDNISACKNMKRFICHAKPVTLAAVTEFVHALPWITTGSRQLKVDYLLFYFKYPVQISSTTKFWSWPGNIPLVKTC